MVTHKCGTYPCYTEKGEFRHIERNPPFFVSLWLKSQQKKHNFSFYILYCLRFALSLPQNYKRL